MRLLAHNMMASHVKGVKNGYPFKIEATSVQTLDADFDPAFVRAMLPRLRYDVLRQAAIEVCLAAAVRLLCSARAFWQLQHGEGLPEALPENVSDDEELLRRLHHVLLQVEVVEGTLICPESGRRFPIRDGCANMLLNEDDV